MYYSWFYFAFSLVMSFLGCSKGTKPFVCCIVLGSSAGIFQSFSSWLKIPSFNVTSSEFNGSTRLHQESPIASVTRTRRSRFSKMFTHSKYVMSTLRGLTLSMRTTLSRLLIGARKRRDRNEATIESRLQLAMISLLNMSSILSLCQSNASSPFGDMSVDVALAMDYISDKNDIWHFVSEEQGIKVWKTHDPICINKEDKRWICIMSRTTIKAPAMRIKKLLLDSSKVTLLNR